MLTSWSGRAEGSSYRTSAEGPAENLLQNGGFELLEGETEYAVRKDPYSGDWATQLRLARGWELWYYNVHACPPYDSGCNPLSYNRRPEYKREPQTGRVRSGQSAQKYFTTYGTHLGGMYQVVEVPADAWLRFSIWAWVWSSQKDVPAHSFLPGDYDISIGIDPTGGVAWDAPEIQWTEPITRYDQWVYLETAARAEGDRVSVWLRSAQRWPVKHNDSYWDDAELVALSAAPTATPTPIPTPTPYPTPQPTPSGYQPPACWRWQTLWLEPFDQAAPSGWAWDAGEGRVAVDAGELYLANASAYQEAFPVAWSTGGWPATGDVRIALRFAFRNPTGYGSTIGVGSHPYAGERTLAAAPGPYGVEDILRVHHWMSSPGVGEYRIDLLGRAAWWGAPGDASWHRLTLELRRTTYVLSVDGMEVARAESYWRPRSLFAGNPVIVWNKGRWTEVALDEVRIEECRGVTCAPLILRDHVVAIPTIPALPLSGDAASAALGPRPSR